MNYFTLYFVPAILFFAFLAPFVMLYILGAVEGLVGEYKKDGFDNVAPVFIFSLVMGGGIIGIFMTLALLGAIHKQHLDDWEINVLTFGAAVCSTLSYFFVHRGVHSMLTFFYSGTTFKGRHLAKISKLGEKREFHKFGTRWLTNMA